MHCLLLVAVKVSQHVNTLVEWEQLEIRLVSIYIWEWRQDYGQASLTLRLN